MPAQGRAKPTGRPSSFTQAMADIICQRIAAGESLRAICKGRRMPNKATVLRWLANDEYAAFRDQYARAREVQADTLFDEILEIADTPMVGAKRKRNADGTVEVTTGDMVEHRRLQIDARKWMAGKLRPKKYGDKIEVDGKMNLGADATVLALMEAVNGKTRSI